MPAAVEYEELADTGRGRVHMSAYTDPGVFNAEMARIFTNAWIYVGHESEVPEPGDFKTTHIGHAPMILTRDRNGQLNVFANRCLHRGVTVCTREKGHAKTFRCPYHGWSYNLKGKLLGGMPSGYAAEEFSAIPKHLAGVAHVESYRGLIFARIAEEGMSLIDWLGNAKPYLDDWCELSPIGVRALDGGVYKHSYHGNWKLQLEGANEGYHVDFLHRVVRESLKKDGGPPLELYVGSTAKGIDLGNGHSVMETPVSDDMWKGFPPEYISQLEARLGHDGMRRVVNQNWRLTLFPNAAFASDNLRVIRPISVDVSEVWQWHVSRPSAPPALNQALVKLHESLYGSAGTAGPDDIEVFERAQEGYSSITVGKQDAWVWLNKGLTTEEIRPDGSRVGHAASEVMQRAIYYAWKDFMSAARSAQRAQRPVVALQEAECATA